MSEMAKLRIMNSVKSLGSQAVDALKKTTVELFLFFIMFGYFETWVTFQSLLHDRSCRLLLNYSIDICDDLENVQYHAEQLHAVTYGNNLYNAYIMIVTVPALVVVIFVGPWSDKYSRKFPLLIAAMGATLDLTFQSIITAFPDASPYWFLASAAVTGCTGGLTVIMSSSFSYLSEITDESSRQTRFAILEFCIMLATPIGSFVGGQVFKIGGYFPVIVMGPCFLSLACLWLAFFVPETKTQKLKATKNEMFRDLFRLDSIKENFRTCTKPRPGTLRKQIWLLIFVNCSLVWLYMGSLGTDFPYVRNIHKWGVPHYSFTTTVFSLCSAALILTVVPLLNKKLKVREAVVGLIGIISLMSKMALMSVTVHEYFVYGALFAGSLIQCGAISVRTRISKLVTKEELGRVFSFLATCEALTPALGTMSMLQIFNHTVSVYPGILYIVAAIFLLPSAAIFVWMLRTSKKSYSEYEENNDTNTTELKDIEYSTKL